MHRRFPALATLLLVAAALPARPEAATPPPNLPSFNLVNNAPQPIRELFVTSAGSANWGQNRLDGRNGNPTGIAAGGAYAVRHRADNVCIYDMKLVFQDGRTEERRGVNTCASEQVMAVVGVAPPGMADAATGKPADDPSVRLFNRAAQPIVEFYATPSGLTNWGQNRLAGPLRPDGKQLVAIQRDGNCIYDLRVVFADKRAQEKKHSNLCRVAELPVP